MVSLTGGTATPAGSVAFFLCKVDSPGLCTTGGTSVGSTNLTGAAYPVTVVSPTAYVTSAGRYCWRAAFSGDSGQRHPGSTDSSRRVLHRQPGDPDVVDDGGRDVSSATPVTDSATLGGTATQPANPVINLTGTGGAAAGGTITFKLYGPGHRLHDAGVYTAAVDGQRQRHVQQPGPQFVPTQPRAPTTGWPSTAGTCRTPTA